MTKEIMEQYEQVRQSGACNMFDYRCVITVADKLKFYDLASLEIEEYKKLLMNFSKYMKQFSIDQH